MDPSVQDQESPQKSLKQLDVTNRNIETLLRGVWYQEVILSPWSEAWFLPLVLVQYLYARMLIIM
jgi:hypothetical protein